MSDPYDFDPLAKQLRQVRIWLFEFLGCLLVAKAVLVIIEIVMRWIHADG